MICGSTHEIMQNKTHFKIEGEHSHNKDYWLGEPKFLGLGPKRSNKVNGADELGVRKGSLKQVIFKDYQTITASHGHKDNEDDGEGEAGLNESYFDYII